MGNNEWSRYGLYGYFEKGTASFSMEATGKICKNYFGFVEIIEIIFVFESELKKSIATLIYEFYE